VYGWQESSGFGFISPTLWLDADGCQLSSLSFTFLLAFHLSHSATPPSHGTSLIEEWGREKNSMVAKFSLLRVLLG